MSTLIAIFLGGGLGALSRYGLSALLARTGITAPWPVLAVNLAGCFAIGIAAAMLTHAQQQTLRVLIIT